MFVLELIETVAFTTAKWLNARLAALDVQDQETVGCVFFCYVALRFVGMTSGVVGRERGERRSRTFFQGGNAIPQYFAAFLAFFC